MLLDLTTEKEHIIARDYQEIAIQMLQEAIAVGIKRLLLKLATGGGKSFIMAKICEMALKKDKKICILVDQITLINQMSETLYKMGIPHGIIQADNPNHDLSLPVQVASIQTYSRRKSWKADIIFVDEAHIVYKGLTDIMARWPEVVFIGVTATPYTNGLGNIYDKLVCPIEINELIKQGYLVDAEIYGPSQPDMTGIKTSGGDFNQQETAKRCHDKKLVASIVETWIELSGGRPTLCYGTDINHSKYIAESFVAKGINAVHIDSYDDGEHCQSIIDRFKKNEINVLCSVGKLTKGLDAPNAEVGIIARPTKSLALHTQIIGRLLRPSPGKEKALLLDHAGNFERLGFHTDEMPHILCDKRKGEKKKREKPLPKPCSKCKYIKPVRESICSNCGFEAKSQNEIFEEKGKLEKIKEPEVKAKKANKDYSVSQKQVFYSGLLKYASQKGYKEGWAAFKYKEKFGVWPNAMKKDKSNDVPEEVFNFIKYLAIKNSHSKNKDYKNNCGIKDRKVNEKGRMA